MKKHLLTALLILALLLLLAPAAFADGEYCTVTFNANGGWFGDNENETEIVTEYLEGDGIWAGAYELVNPDRHLAFTGWYYDAACTQLACDPGEGQFWDGINTEEIVIPKGSEIGGGYIPDLPDSELEFQYWALADGTRVYTGSYTPTGDVTIYAHYGRNYNVTFDANGGWFREYGNEKVHVKRSVEGEQIWGDYYELAHPDRHMALEGWYYDAACTQPGEGQFWDGINTEEIVIPKGSEIGGGYIPDLPDLELEFQYWALADGTRVNTWYFPAGDITLYAHYGRNYTVTFDANGGWFGDDENETEIVTRYAEGANIWARAYEPVNPDRHMAFAGWYYDAACTQLACDRDADYTVTGDVTLYAGWTEGYIVTYNANGGWFWDDENVTEIIKSCPKGIHIYAGGYEPANPDRHMAFSGWYYDAACMQFACDRDADYTVTGDVTLYAGWTEGYIVTFDAGEGQFGGGGKTYDVTIPKGSPIERYYVPDLPDSELEFQYWTLADGTRVNTYYIPAGDITLYAHYGQNYTITYIANGGWFGDDESRTIITNVYEEGESVWGGSVIPKHADRHMALAGWYFDAACTQQAFDRNGYYTVTGDVTLYAGWAEGYIVTFDAGEGHFRDGEKTKEIIFPNGSQIGAYYSPEPPDSSMKLQYWTLADGTQVDFWQCYPTTDITVYAHYGRLYNVTFDANGGWFTEYGNTSVLEKTSVEGGQIWGNNYVLAHPDRHMALEGWYYDAACTEPAFSWNEYYTVTGDVTLYAGWAEGYIVTFDAGDGYFGGGERIQELTILKGRLIGYYIAPYSADAELSFAYWTLADGTRVNTGPIFSFEGAYIPTGDVTLYAHYGRVYTVTFDANGGWFSDYGNQTVIDSIYVEGNTISGRSYEPQHPDRLMGFNGWYYDAACTEPAFGQDESYTVTGDVTFYAGWSEGWIVSFDPGDGYFEEGTVTIRTVPKGSALNSCPYPESSDPAYVFGYWELDGNKIKNIRHFIPDGDVILHAHYVLRRTVIFDANGGTFPGRKRVEWNLREEFEIDEEFRQMIGLVLTHSDERMAFTGWYSDAACTTLVAGPNDTITINGDMILYAGWAEGYYVSFDANGGSNAPAEHQLVSPDGTTALTGRVPARDGWFFVGWADSADADAPQFYPNEAMLTQADLTLYAVWKQPDFILPAGLTEIGEEAFSGGDFSFVLIPANTASIAARAFSGCEKLQYVAIMAYAPEIDSTAFDTDSALTVIGNGSVVYQLAKDKGFHHVSLG